MKLLLIVLFIISSSCSQRIKVPINRFSTPEVIGGGIQFESHQAGHSKGVVDFSNNSTSNPLIMSTSTDQEFYMGVGVSDMADFFVKVPQESTSQLGIKIQFLGTPSKAAGTGHTMAFTLAKGTARDEFEDTFTITLKAEMSDYSLLHGYRFNPYFMIYDGLSVSNYRFLGSISGATGLDSNEIDLTAKDIYSGFIGVVMGSSSFQLKVEYALQKITWTGTDEKLFQHLGVSLGAGW